MKRPQWITLAAALVLLVVLYKYGRIVPEKKPTITQQSNTSDDGLSTDTILSMAKKELAAGPNIKVKCPGTFRSKGNVKEQQLNIYHQLAHFWLDTGRVFEPYALYEAEAARLENSEKSLTFAAHLFLQNLRGENDPALKTWKALQAKDLFERSLKINPANDSSAVGLGACYVFATISPTPMEGVMKVRAIAEKDSTNIFAQEVLGHGSMLSGQYDKAIARFATVFRLSGENAETKLEACLMLAEAYERIEDKSLAIMWYQKSLALIKNEQVKAEVEKRIDELRK